MPSSGAPALEPWMTDGVAAALREAGCPAVTADRLAVQARIERVDGQWLLILLGHGSAVDIPADRAVWDDAALAVAENVAASNAEAVDRSLRGESDAAPLWPLPERRPRS